MDPLKKIPNGTGGRARHRAFVFIEWALAIGAVSGAAALCVPALVACSAGLWALVSIDERRGYAAARSAGLSAGASFAEYRVALEMAEYWAELEAREARALAVARR